MASSGRTPDPSPAPPKAPVHLRKWPLARSSGARIPQDQYPRRMPRAARPVEVALDVAEDPAPLRHRIADALVAELRAGRLRPGDTLPSTRALAAAAQTLARPRRRRLRRAGRGGLRREPGGVGRRRRTGSRPGRGGRRRTHVHTPSAERPGPDSPRRPRHRAGTCGPAAPTPRSSTRPRGAGPGGPPDRSCRATTPERAPAHPAAPGARRAPAPQPRRRGRPRRPPRRARRRRLAPRAPCARSASSASHRGPRGPRLHRGLDRVLAARELASRRPRRR